MPFSTLEFLGVAVETDPNCWHAFEGRFEHRCGMTASRHCYAVSRTCERGDALQEAAVQAFGCVPPDQVLHI